MYLCFMKKERIVELQKIVQQHLLVDVGQFILKNYLKLIKDELNWVSEQILSRQKAKNKLPNWYSNPNLVFPPPLSIEQSSSEITADYKAKLFQGDSFIDLTGGMGLDSIALAKVFKKGFYFETQSNVFETAKGNFEQFNQKNIEFFNENSIDFLAKNDIQLDLIYFDPARRDSQKKKVFQLSDCEPNAIEIQDLFLQKSANILIKTSPLLDISLIINSLKFIKTIHIVAVENDVKEILIEIKKGFDKEINIKTINFGKERTEEFDFKFKAEQSQKVNFSLPKKYIYEPNNAILKSGGFKSIAVALGLEKLAVNSHLYTADSIIDFPGRVFEVMGISKVNACDLKIILPEMKGNLSIRNFPDSVENLKKKLKIKDGGNNYIFATTDCTNKKNVLVCKKIN
jgi:16S rRNA G966 N2-methylase RsmD